MVPVASILAAGGSSGLVAVVLLASRGLVVAPGGRVVIAVPLACSGNRGVGAPLRLWLAAAVSLLQSAPAVTHSCPAFLVFIRLHDEKP